MHWSSYWREHTRLLLTAHCPTTFEHKTNQQRTGKSREFENELYWWGTEVCSMNWNQKTETLLIIQVIDAIICSAEIHLRNKMCLWNTMPPIMANSNEGQDHKEKYYDTSRKILSQEMTMCNMEALLS